MISKQLLALQIHDAAPSIEVLTHNKVGIKMFLNSNQRWDIEQLYGGDWQRISSKSPRKLQNTKSNFSLFWKIFIFIWETWYCKIIILLHPLFTSCILSIPKAIPLLHTPCKIQRAMLAFCTKNVNELSPTTSLMLHIRCGQFHGCRHSFWRVHRQVGQSVQGLSHHTYLNSHVWVGYIMNQGWWLVLVYHPGLLCCTSLISKITLQHQKTYSGCNNSCWASWLIAPLLM